jgi:hypothetical protein
MRFFVYLFNLSMYSHLLSLILSFLCLLLRIREVSAYTCIFFIDKCIAVVHILVNHDLTF